MVPGDLSSAAFFLTAGLIVPDSNLILTNVGLNPTRTALLDVLKGMGADIRLLSIEQLNGELIGNLQVQTSRMRGGLIEGATTAAVIDEVPILAILGAASEQGLSVRDAGELRVKETDRIDALANNLRRMGVECSTTATSIDIPAANSACRGVRITRRSSHCDGIRYCRSVSRRSVYDRRRRSGIGFVSRVLFATS